MKHVEPAFKGCGAAAPSRFLAVVLCSVLEGCWGRGVELPCLSLEAPPLAGGPVLAQVGNTELHAAHLLPLRAEEHGAEGEERLMRRLEDRVRFELLAQAAWREHFGRDPQVIEAARQVMVRRFLQQKVPLVSPEQDLDEAALRRAYEVNRHLYLKPELRRLDIIALPATAGTRRLLEQLLHDLHEGIAVEEALRISTRAARHPPPHSGLRPYTGAEPHLTSLPFRSERELTQKIGQAAAKEIFALEQGVWAPAPITTARGLWLVNVAARRADVSRSFEEVREDLVALLTRQRRSLAFAQLIERLRSEREVALFAERVEALVRGAPPPATPVAHSHLPLQLPQQPWSSGDDDAANVAGRAGLGNLAEVSP